MSEEAKNKKKYGVADFERYYNGKMQPHEMHELEKAALEDSFLADALEGYIQTHTPSADIDELKSRLRSKQQNAKVFALHEWKKYNKLFRVAAMAIGMLGAGWLVFEFAFNKSETDISFSKQPEIPKSPSNANKSNEEHSSIEQKLVVDTVEELKERPNRVINKVNKRIPHEKELSKQPLPESHAMKMESGDSVKYDINDQVAAVASSRSAPTQNQEASQDTHFSAKRSIVVVGAENMHPKRKSNSNDKQVMITIMKANDGVNELVLKLPMKDSTYKKAPSILIEEAEPEESWSKFGEYISDNIKTPEDPESESIKGTVKISFDVNNKGEPVNLHVEKSLCEKCDAEALRLLMEGPKWKRKTKRGKVSITF